VPTFFYYCASRRETASGSALIVNPDNMRHALCVSSEHADNKVWLTQWNVLRLSWRYSRITYTNYPSFCMPVFNASLTNFTAFLPKSHDCSCSVSRRILAPSATLIPEIHWCTRARIRALSLELWHQPRLAKGTCACNWRLCDTNPAIAMMILLWCDTA